MTYATNWADASSLDWVDVSFLCRLCNRTITVHVRQKDLDTWADLGSTARVQDVFPYLTPGERELFLTGFCDQCWGSLIANEDEDEEPPYDPPF